jgi:hypothetical protein
VGRITRALQNEARDGDLGQVGTVVGQKCHAREMLGNIRVSLTKAVLELLAQFRALWIAHDHRGHRAGPAEIIGVLEVEQPVDVILG